MKTQKYYINTETSQGGKILHFVKKNEGFNHEVTNAEYVQAQKNTENNTLHKDENGNITFSLVDYTTDEEKKELIKTQKKQQYNKYCELEINPYYFSDTILIDVTSKNLVLLLEKLTGWKSDTTHINWMEDGEWLQLTKVDLQKICTYAEDLKQAKFETIFGFGE